MSEVKLSERAQKILSTFAIGEIYIRQQSLAEQLGCSRRTIGRALKELKEAGLLVDLNKRHENRCKLYEIKNLTLNPSPASGEGLLTLEAQRQWELYEKTFRIVFKAPDLEQNYRRVVGDLRHVTEEMDLWRKTWAGLRVVYGQPPVASA